MHHSSFRERENDKQVTDKAQKRPVRALSTEIVEYDYIRMYLEKYRPVENQDKSNQLLRDLAHSCPISPCCPLTHSETKFYNLSPFDSA